MSTEDFEKMVGDDWIPDSEEGIMAELRRDLTDAGSKVSNKSTFSPFFRLIGVLITKPLLSLREFIIKKVMAGMFLKTAMDEMLDNKGWGVNEERISACKAAGELTFYRAANRVNLLIPVGTKIQSPEIDGVVYTVITTADAVIEDGQYSVKALIEAEYEGAAYNLGDGYYSILISSVDGITQVVNETDWLTTPGRNIESNDDFRERCRLKWKKQSGFHVEDAYRLIINEATQIPLNCIYFVRDAPRGPGTANAYIMDTNGLPTQAQVDAANAMITDDEMHGLGDDVLVYAISSLLVDFSVTVTADDSADATDKAELQSGIEDLIRCIFRENSAYSDRTVNGKTIVFPKVSPFSTLSLSKIMGEIHDRFHLANSVSFPGMSNITAVLELPVLNSLTVTVP